MSITVRDHKMLWGRSGARCAMCKVQLATITDIGSSVVIGEEAHIVARSPTGARGESPLRPKQRDEYSNLILLCPTDHSRIDDLPSGPEIYPVSDLLDIKRDHEATMMTEGIIDRDEQLSDEQWAYIVDELQRRLDWDHWQDRISPLFWGGGGGPLLLVSVRDDLRDAAEWIYTRFWPAKNDELQRHIEDLGRVLVDLLRVFESHAISEPAVGDSMLGTERFYRIDRWDEVAYARLLSEYKEHVAVVEELTYLLTQYCNLVCLYVRRNIDTSFRFEQGALTVRVADGLKWSVERPELPSDNYKSDLDGRYLGVESVYEEIARRATQ